MKKKIEIDLEEQELSTSQELGLNSVLTSAIEALTTKCLLHPKKVLVDGNVAWLKEK
jgi:hypothetical protein